MIYIRHKDTNLQRGTLDLREGGREGTKAPCALCNAAVHMYDHSVNQSILSVS